MAAGFSWTVIALSSAGSRPGDGRLGRNLRPLLVARAFCRRGSRAAVPRPRFCCSAPPGLFQRNGEPIDLGSAVFLGTEAFGYRLAFAAAAFGLICLAGRYSVGPPSPPRDRWAWAGSALLLLGAALCDTPLAALPLIAAGTAAAALYADRRRMGEGLAVAAVALLAVLAAAGIWETAYRLALRRWSETVLLNKVTPPSRGEMEALGKEIQGHFARIDLAALVPRAPAGLERQDLAYALWRSSPLARPYSLSALVVMPLEGEPSFFSFGMPLTQGKVDWSPERWRGLGLPLWEESPVSGEIGLKLAGKPWGKAHFSLMPRPGFELRDRRRLGEAEVGLLKGGPAADPVQELLEPAVYALYTQSGSPSLSPWDRDAAPGGATAAERRPGLGHRQHAGGPRPRLQPYDAGCLGGHLPAVPAAAVRGGADLELGAGRPPHPDPGRAAGPFAVPAPRLLPCAPGPGAALVFEAADHRLHGPSPRAAGPPQRRPGSLPGEAASRQQRAAGEAALASAQRVLGERLLSSNPASASAPRSATGCSRPLRVIRHEMSLYWGSDVYASSKRELFAAGLLPRRIPGEISAGSPCGATACRRARTGSARAYLEIYAPLAPPGSRARSASSSPCRSSRSRKRRRQGLGTSVGAAAMTADYSCSSWPSAPGWPATSPVR